jgi:cobalt-zinc-cadmium efflux system membrane fusion protein
VRVAIPVAEKSNVLTVPTSAVQQEAGQAFVFVAESENRFRRTDVVTGNEGKDRIEIVRGLQANDRVVTRGAFILKSELLLEGEE